MKKTADDLLMRDPITGALSYWHFDELTGLATIETVQDVTSTVEENKALFCNMDSRAPWKGEVMNHVATVPMQLWARLQRQFMREEGGDMHAVQQRWKAWLNDPDNRVFRTRPGRL